MLRPSCIALHCREHLLQLPHNSAAFALLQDQGMHPAYKNLASQLQAPGSSTSTAANRLAACLSQLAHWCPLFGKQELTVYVQLGPLSVLPADSAFEPASMQPWNRRVDAPPSFKMVG